MKPRQENHQEPDLNNLTPAEEAEISRGWQEFDAANLPSDVLVTELRNREYTVIAPLRFDEATGLLISDGKYYDPETKKPVSEQEAYRRASGGW